VNPNLELRDAVFAAVRPYLGRYSQNGSSDRGLAFWPPSGSTQPDTPVGYVASAVEVIVSLWPEDVTGQYEFGSTGLSGVLHYSVTAKAWTGTTAHVREALYEAFPLLTTNVAKRPRFVPASAEFIETLQVFVPIMTD